MDSPFISVIIPCRSEQNYVAGALDSLLAQEGVSGDIEILVADGMSDDGTTEILQRYEKKFPQVRVLMNHKKIVPFALTLLLAEAKGKFIIRADAHCVYPSDYVATLANYLIETDADNVGGVWNTVAGAQTAQAVAIASCLNSKFGTGVSYRTLAGKEPVEVETVPFGAWRADHFKKYGTFDDKFIRAQDLEHNIRVKKMGGKIVCLPWLKVTYYARDTFEKLKKMALQYGYWKIPVNKKHHIKFSLRQYFPVFLVVGTILSVLLGLTVSPWFLVFLCSYFFVNVAVSFWKALSERMLYYVHYYAYAFAIMHFYYGFGYLLGLWDVYVTRKISFTEITR